MKRLLSSLLLALLLLVGCSDTSIWGGDREVLYDGDIWVEHFTQPRALSGVDVLWVIDRSGSMLQYQENVLDGIEEMIIALPPSGWRLNMITTDFNDALTESNFPLVPGNTVTDALSMYQNLSEGPREAGLEASWTYILNNPEADFWLRDDAALLVVIVSDELDQSPTIEPDEWVDWFEHLRGTGASFVATITNPNDEAGYDYVVDQLSGTKVDINSEDWSTGVEQATKQVEPYEQWELAYTPVAASVEVFQDGLPSTGWWLDGTTIYFDAVPEPGTLVEIAYVIEGTQSARE